MEDDGGIMVVWTLGVVGTCSDALFALSSNARAKLHGAGRALKFDPSEGKGGGVVIATGIIWGPQHHDPVRKNSPIPTVYMGCDEKAILWLENSRETR
jgi:hypothetical protein